MCPTSSPAPSKKTGGACGSSEGEDCPFSSFHGFLLSVFPPAQFAIFANSRYMDRVEDNLDFMDHVHHHMDSIRTNDRPTLVVCIRVGLFIES